MDEQYPVVLAHDISEEKSRQFISEYDIIAAACAVVGKPCFVPYRHVGIEGDELSKRVAPRLAHGKINDVAIPNSGLVLVFGAFESLDVGTMLGRAQREGKPYLLIVPEGRPVPRVSLDAGFVGTIKYNTPEELERKVELAVRQVLH